MISRPLSRSCIAALLVVAQMATKVAGETSSISRTGLFQEIWETVRDNFFDKNFNGVDWEAARQRFSAQVDRAQTDDEFAALVNQMLAELRTSHTRYYTAQEPAYFQLCGIFWEVLEPKLKRFLSGDKPDYVGIGAFTTSKDGKLFVSDVLDASPAAVAGLKTGDEILSVDEAPFHPIGSFAGKAGQQTRIKVRRTFNGSPIILPTTPKVLDPRTMFLDGMKASVEIINHRGVKVGYIHIWSYAGEAYQDQLEAELDTRLHDADALVLDLRNGYGGAGPAYLRPFLVPPLTTTWTARDGKHGTHEEAWTKPVCLLVNEGTKSGKEVLAYYFKKAQRGPIVGTRTAGAVMAGKPFVLKDGSLLYLAVGDGLIDGKRPEGNGVAPDVEVPSTTEYAQGQDPQKQRAVEVIGREVHPQ
jgi:carboxyl-terminal processing protease